MSFLLWPRLRPDEVCAAKRGASTEQVQERARAIVEDVRSEGLGALLRWTSELDGPPRFETLVLHRDELKAAAERIPTTTRALLERTARRIERFATLQRSSIQSCTLALSGGFARQELSPMARAGCYAPGGRYPLVSSVLMTAVTARVAGVGKIVAASPNPKDEMLAAAYIAGVETLLCCGGAQAIAALSYGVDGLAPVDIVVGPGNAFVTAAKQIVSHDVAIDMPAGPSELIVLSDESADPRLLAADLLAQAEHDVLARAFLVSPSEILIENVERELATQLTSLPSSDVAREALAGSGSILTRDLEEACRVCNELAPEHLELLVAQPEAVKPALEHYGALFVGSAAAEVFGDYGIGPNHVLPTGGGSRRSGGLSVFDFLRIRTVLECESIDPEVALDTVALAEIEGLDGHARAAALRMDRR